MDSASPAWSETHDIRWQWFGLSELGPVVLPKQFERELELVVQRQAPVCVSDSRLVSDYLPHVA
jgi:hypothetical protein